jgi:hypothetical protein
MTGQQVSDVEKNVWIILRQCQPEPRLYGYSSGLLNVPHVGMNFESVQVEGIEHLQVYKANNEQVELLRSLYQAQDEDGKNVVLGICSKALLVHSCSAQAFVFLARHHSFRYALQLLVTTPRPNFLPVATRTLPALAQVLRCDHSFVPKEDLEALCPQLTKALAHEKPKGTAIKIGPRTTIRYSAAESRQLDQFKPVERLIGYICKQAERIQYLRLRKELHESSNFEINQDRDRLLDSLNSLGFSDRLTEFLKFAEVEFGKARDVFSYKTCIDQMRSFFAELLTETAEKIAIDRGETLAKAKVDKKYPVQVRQYLQDTGFFSEQFRTLVDGLYKFMSDEGTHTLDSTKDVARIARNIAIEIGLLITKRIRLDQLRG